MSPPLRAELMRVMFEVEREQDWDTELPTYNFDHEDFYPSMDETLFMESAKLSRPEDAGNAKTVIEIDERQVEALIANLNEKSVETLKLFASGEPVDLESLIGDERPYATFIDLKRSFVGPVNRRLRTVTRNRTAVLFRKVSEDESDIRIDVKPGTAEAIRNILGQTTVINHEE